MGEQEWSKADTKEQQHSAGRAEVNEPGRVRSSGVLWSARAFEGGPAAFGGAELQLASVRAAQHQVGAQK